MILSVKLSYSLGNILNSLGAANRSSTIFLNVKSHWLLVHSACWTAL